MVDLKAENIQKKEAKSCCMEKKIVFVYSLPISLEPSVLTYIGFLGTTSLSFEKTSLLMLDSQDLYITGIKKFKEIKLTLKNKDKIELIDAFEEGLLKYVKAAAERK